RHAPRQRPQRVAQLPRLAHRGHDAVRTQDHHASRRFIEPALERAVDIGQHHAAARRIAIERLALGANDDRQGTELLDDAARISGLLGTKILPTSTDKSIIAPACAWRSWV